MSAEFTFLSAAGSQAAGSTVACKGLQGMRIQVYSAAGSSATVLIQGSENGSIWITLATLTNPALAGEIWQGTAMPYMRGNVSAWSSGAITMVGSSLPTNPGAWAAMSASAASGLSRGLIKFPFTAASLIAAAGAVDTLSLDVLIGSLPAKSRLAATYVVITTADDSAQNFSVSMGVTGTAYVDWIVASDAKSATVYGNAVAERGATNIDGALYYATAQDVYLQFIKTTTHIQDIASIVGTAYVEYVTYP